MKSLNEYITESYITESVHILKLNAKNAQVGVNIEDKLRAFINHSKKRYSFNNKQDREQFFNDFYNYAKIKSSELKEFGLTDGTAIANLIIAKKDELEKDGWKFNAIKSFDETASQKEYKKWKESDDYVAGEKFDRNDFTDADKEELKRTLVVYDVHDPGNPETTLKFPFSGTRKSNDHQAHMCSVEWKYETGLKYFDARQILLSNYLKKSDAELAKREVFNTDDDLEEI